MNAQRQFLIVLAGAIVAGIVTTSAWNYWRDKNRQPTAMEVFRLRSECAALGQKILQDYNTSQNYTPAHMQVSRYDTKTNRFYVRLQVISNDSINTILYDGQTQERLASTLFEADGRKSGIIFVDTSESEAKNLKEHQQDRRSIDEADYAQAFTFIKKMMADDRTQ
jgi:hypothetical protein